MGGAPFWKPFSDNGHQTAWARVFVPDQPWKWTRDMLVLYHSHFDARSVKQPLPFPKTHFRITRESYMERQLTMNIALNAFVNGPERFIIPSLELFEPMANYSFTIHDMRTKAGCALTMDDITSNLLLKSTKEVIHERDGNRKWWQELKFPKMIEL